MTDKQQDIYHLYSRFGFGLGPKEPNFSDNLGKAVRHLFSSSRKYQALEFIDDVRPDNRDSAPLRVLLATIKSKKDVYALNAAWLKNMTKTSSVLREQMTLFWHDHFATNVAFGILMQEQNNLIRNHALGSFREMLHDMARNPAMILYLNNQQNRKRAPNENFAREVMELFSLGEGHYTEKDIKEAARTFTGWHVNNIGRFEFNESQHDFEEKTIFGKTGNFNGEEVIDMLLDKPQTARYICRKMYAYFVNPIVDEEVVDVLSDVFYKSDYDISKLLEAIVGSSWFYEKQNHGVIVKSPTQLIVQVSRLTGLEFKKKKMLVDLQKSMGQVLFFPPNVAGWNGGLNWIDSSTMLERLKFPMECLDKSGFKYFDSGDETFSEFEAKNYRRKFKTDWSRLEKHNKSEIKLNHFVNLLIRCPQDNIDLEYIVSGAQTKGGLELKKVVIALMSLPEFQLA